MHPLPGGRERGGGRRGLTLACAVLIVAAACTDGVPTGPAPLGTGSDSVRVFASYYENAGVLSSSPDTCPWYTIPAELWDPYQIEAEEPSSNPDSVEASYGANAENPDYYAPLMVLDDATGAEMYAGPCEVARNRCWAKCRKLPPDKRLRALCWGGCMAAYAYCKQRERANTPPVTGGCPSRCDTQIIYDPETCELDSGSCGGGSGGGGDDGGGGMTCRTEYIIIEINDGTGWRTWWEGYATVCE